MIADYATLAAGLPDPPGGLAANRGSGMLFNDVFLILGAALAIGLILALIIKIAYRKRGSGKSAGTGSAGGILPGSRRRREHRPRNPTLAETGGLPPPRPEPPPPPPQT